MRERGRKVDMKTEITFFTDSLNYSEFKTEEVKLMGLEWFRYIHGCFDQLLNLFWQADELSGKFMASYKITHCISILKHKGTTGQLICQFHCISSLLFSNSTHRTNDQFEQAHNRS